MCRLTDIVLFSVLLGRVLFGIHMGCHMWGKRRQISDVAVVIVIGLCSSRNGGGDCGVSI